MFDPLAGLASSNSLLDPPLHDLNFDEFWTSMAPSSLLGDSVVPWSADENDGTGEGGSDSLKDIDIFGEITEKVVDDQAVAVDTAKFAEGVQSLLSGCVL